MKLFILLFLFPLFAHAYTFSQSMAQKGFPQGIFAQESIEVLPFYVRLPSSKLITSGKLTLEIESSPLLKDPSNLKVLFEGAPLAHISLKGQGNISLTKHTIVMDIPKSLLKNKYGRFDFQFVNIISGDPCLDQKMSSGLVRITEKSSFDLTLKERPTNISDFILTLGSETYINLPESPLSLEELKLLYQVGAIVRQQGSALQYTQKRESADIVLNRDIKNHQIVQTKLKDPEELITQFFLSTSTPFSATPFLLDLSGVFNNSTLPVEKIFQDGERVWLTRNELSLKAEGEKTSNGAYWSLKVPTIAGSDLKPAKLHLSLTSARSSGDHPVSLYVYAGDELIKVINLPNSDLPQYHQVLLPNRFAKWPFNINVLIKRNDPKGGCNQDFGRDFDVRLLEDSALEYTKTENKASSFVSFAMSDSKYEIIFPKELVEPQVWISKLNWLQKSFNLNVDSAHFTFSPIGLSRYIELKTMSLDSEVIIPYLANQRFKTVGLSKVGLLTLKSNEKTQGLLLQAMKAPFKIDLPNYVPDHHDVLAFTPERIEILSYSSELKDKVAKLSGGPSIVTFLEEWRYILMGLGWLLLTLLFLALGRKFR